MPHRSTVFNVLIASPMDVEPERKIARDIILEWNAINARSRRMLLQPIAWETHAAPEMGDRAQAILNRQIVDDADLLVAIFWTRIGTDTGEAPGGSVEELRRHMAAGKPAMVYFSDAVAKAEHHLDPQFKRLQEFRAELIASRQGFIESYATVDEFKDKFRRQLAIRVNDDDYFSEFEAAAEVDDGPIDFEDEEPDLSAEARTLLIAAAGDRNGYIICRDTVSHGFLISTNNQQFVEPLNPRSRATWENAIRELEYNHLIEAQRANGLYKVTLQGFELADELKARQA